MKKWFLLVAAGIVMIATVDLWFVLGDEQEEFVLPERKITFISPMANSGYWGNAAGGMLDRGKEYNIDVKCVGFSELSLEKQIYAIENAVLSGSDGIITVAYEDSPEFRAAVEVAGEADIPVLFIDSDLKNIDRLCYIGSDNYYAGQLAGMALADECEGKGQIAIITSYISNANQTERIVGFKDALKEYPEIEIVEVLEGQSDDVLLNEKIVRMLEEKTQIDGIFCAEGYGSSRICNLIEEKKINFPNLKVVAFDLSQTTRHALEQGVIKAVIRQDPYEMGCRAVDELQGYFSGKTEESKDQHIEVQLVVQENIQANEYKTREDILWHTY